jgi:hypothetical protein
MVSRTVSGQHRALRRGALAACVGVLIAVSACHRNVEVRTAVAPGAQLAGRRTFRILPVPEYRGSVPLASTDPMLVNSITYEALRQEIRRAFEQRGYRYVPQGADFDVAYYATAAQKLDIRSWDYGYDWRGIPVFATEVIPYEEGAVIIDVIDPVTHRLLWRGEGRAVTSDDPNKYLADLRRAVHAIVEKFPPASP